MLDVPALRANYDHVKSEMTDRAGGLEAGEAGQPPPFAPVPPAARQGRHGRCRAGHPAERARQL